MNPSDDKKNRPDGNLIVLLGPTAVGKTAVALELAQRLNGEIVNADSMQVYQGMDIGTAKPTPHERKLVRFHLLDMTTPDIQFTVADWKEYAERALEDIRTRGKAPILCGGTGLYIRALLDNWTLAGTPADPAVRAELLGEVEIRGSPALHLELQQADPSTAARLHPNDAVRIVRALEVYRITGKPISEYQDQDKATHRRRPAIQIGLTMPRPLLYERIENRVDAMISEGFEKEVRSLLAQGFAPALGAMKSLGYKEMIQFVMGELDYSGALNAIKQDTRRFAKRQQTWLAPGMICALEWLSLTLKSN